MDPCRKCQTPNPSSNQYCLNCGAVLSVSTMAVAAQPKAVTPKTVHFRWRWVALGGLTILGTATLATGAIIVAAIVFLRDTGNESIESIGSNAPGFAVGAALVFLLAFAFGGLVTSRMSPGRTIKEPVLASLLVVTLLGISASAVSLDAIFAAGALAVPCAAMTALGSWFGEIFEGRGER